jgi:hypothetical protein
MMTMSAAVKLNPDPSPGAQQHNKSLARSVNLSTPAVRAEDDVHQVSRTLTFFFA